MKAIWIIALVRPTYIKHDFLPIYIRGVGQRPCRPTVTSPVNSGILWYCVPRLWSPNRHFLPRGEGCGAVGVFSSAWGLASNIYRLVYFTAYCTRHRPSRLGYNLSISLCMWVTVRGFKKRQADRLWQFLHCATRASTGSTTAVAPLALLDKVSEHQ